MPDNVLFWAFEELPGNRVIVELDDIHTRGDSLDNSTFAERNVDDVSQLQHIQSPSISFDQLILTNLEMSLFEDDQSCPDLYSGPVSILN